MGRPKKYGDKKWDSHSIFLSVPFSPYWDKFVRLAAVDNDNKFKEYCLKIEHVDLDKKQGSKLDIYLRYVITSHLLRNIIKLQKDDYGNISQKL